ncbi:amidophosphoribosyltransferase [Clostridium sp. MB40-C1]|uniref:amidophosphoribosyltransferase n=1 Tax=Clostridium sp. MB40-C1 TaxID=3070996 RepID=UPI0027DF0CB6|nr:amidophosphoribosyltransferase [Clostridium sp. MB40-C1]WMJ81910.1 amidophosphoribosyltransferase [Clostridium sp. MB40-C1]
MNKDKFKEECGIFGVFSKKKYFKVSYLTYYGLYALQHRGQESSGITVARDNKLFTYKDMGLVREIYTKDTLNNLIGSSSIGHVRYSTTGDSNVINAQPLLGNFKSQEIAIAHNGNLINSEILRKELIDKGVTFNTTTDSEVILKLIETSGKENIEESIIYSVKKIKGSFSVVVLTPDKLLCIRDPKGIRPLCLGKIENSYIIASESCALDTINATFSRNVMPGEIVVIDKNGLKSINYSSDSNSATCVFEYIYFSREDSTIDNVNVYHSRYLCGKQLYKECPADGDVVIGVPNSGIPAAMGYAKASGIPYVSGFTKNNYIDRSFIQPSQNLREECISIKLNPIKSNINGKRVIVIDDSLVRGNTSKKIVAMLKNCGAKEVHFRVASPIVKHCCHFGIDTFNKNDLLGSYMSLDDIKKNLQADSIGYLSIKGLIKSIGRSNLCLGCFNGMYPI